MSFYQTGAGRAGKYCVLLGMYLLTIPLQAEKRIIVFVALADNFWQGIVPVSMRLGDGDNPESNLYWGSADGMQTVFDRSKELKLVSKSKGDDTGPVLRTRLYRHKRTGATLQAMAYRGRNIKNAIADFEASINDRFDLVVFIGHNGLMDFSLDLPVKKRVKKSDVIVLGCKSERYFKPRLNALGARPLLLTTQNMYPGAFILHAALQSYLAGRDTASIRRSAADAYAKNQRIGLKPALGVFSVLQ